MLLQPPNPALPPKSVKDICDTFGIDLVSSNPLKTFLEVLDTNLHDPTKAIQAALLLPSGDSNSGTLTNGLWCMGEDNSYLCKVSLSYKIVGLEALIDNIFSWFASNIPGFTSKKSPTLPDIILTFSRTTIFNLAAPEDADLMTRIPTLTITFPVQSFYLNIDILQYSKQVLLTPLPTSSSIRSILQDVFQGAGNLSSDLLQLLPGNDSSDPFSSLFDHFYLWYIQVTYDTVQWAGRNLQWGVGLLCFWKPKDIPICVALTYDSASSTFLGRLMLQQHFADATDLRSPAWDPRLSPNSILNAVNLKPSDLQPPNLWDLVGLPPEEQLPIPTLLTSAEVSFSQPGGPGTGSLFQFSASLGSSPISTTPDPSTSAAPSGFKWRSASVDFAIVSPPPAAGTKPAKSYSIDVGSTFRLDPVANPDPNATPIPSAFFSLALRYDTSNAGSTWLMRASAQNLSVGLLASFFDADTSSGAMAVLSKINLKYLSVLYTYKKSTASSFLMTGILTLGALELDLSYQYVSALVTSDDVTAAGVHLQGGGQLPNSPDKIVKTGNSQTTWSFFAKLSVTSPDSTIKSVANSIVDGGGDRLPPFVADIPLSTATSGNPQVELQFSSASGTSGKTSVLSVWLSIAGFSLTFVSLPCSRLR
jgi:hypothetical protein